MGVLRGAKSLCVYEVQKVCAFTRCKKLVREKKSKRYVRSNVKRNDVQVKVRVLITTNGSGGYHYLAPRDVATQYTTVRVANRTR